MFYSTRFAWLWQGKRTVQVSFVLGAHTGLSMVGVAYASLAAFADVP